MKNLLLLIMIYLCLTLVACTPEETSIKSVEDMSEEESITDDQIINSPIPEKEDEKTLKIKTPTEIAKDTFPSVVLITIKDNNNQPVSFGSGFFVTPNVIATNYHVIKGASSGTVRLLDGEEEYNILGTVDINPLIDLALIKIERDIAKPLIYQEENMLEIGEKVYAIGNPLGLTGTFSEGIISGIREFDEEKLIQISSPISPGSSGGPILNDKGEVIGIAVATIKGGQNLNLAIPSQYLKPMINKMSSNITPLTAELENKTDSIIDEMGNSNITEQIIGENFIWSNNYYGGDFSYSVRNTLKEHIQNVVVMLVFYDSQGNPLDIQLAIHEDIIPSGLARRIDGSVSEDVKKLTTKDSYGEFSPQPFSKLEYRILNFEFVQ